MDAFLQRVLTRYEELRRTDPIQAQKLIDAINRLEASERRLKELEPDALTLHRVCAWGVLD